MRRLTISGHVVVLTACEGNERRMWRVTADNKPIGVLIDNVGDWQPTPLYSYGRVPVVHCATQFLALETLLAETIDHQEMR